MATSNFVKDKKIVFITILSFLIVTSWIELILDHSSNISSYYILDYTNTFMDYFNTMSLLYYPDPYSTRNNYPALCFLCFKLIYSLLPLPIIDEYSNGFFLRNFMPSELSFIVMIVLCISAITILIKTLFVNDNCFLKNVIVLSILLSGPLVFALERGNIIIVAFTMTLGYTLFYNSDNKKMRYLSYVMLSIAAGIKIYPALFGLMTIVEKKITFKEKTVLVLIGILVFTIPFFFFNGLESISNFINGYIYSSGIDWGCGYNFSFYSLTRIILSFFKISIEYSVFLLAIPTLLFFIIFVSKEKWKKIFGISLLCIWMPTYSFTYALLFMIIPLLFYLNDDSENNSKYSILFALIMAPLITPMADIVNDFLIGVIYPISYGMIIINFAILGLTLLLSAGTIKRLRAATTLWSNINNKLRQVMK